MRLALTARLVFANLILLVTATTAFAECEILPPFCEHFWSAGVVFDGTVIRTEPIELEAEALVLRGDVAVNVKQMTPHTRVTFSVNQAWRGVSTQEVEIVERGRSTLRGRWIVVAEKSPDGTLFAVWCGATQEYERAGEKLAFLRSLELPAQGGRIFGDVFIQDRLHPAAKSGSDFVPVVTRVTLKGENLERSIVSTDGRYEFSGLRAGSYSITIDAPPAKKGAGTVNLKIPNPRACAKWDFWLEPSASITGEILDKDGKPASSVKVQLLAADRWREPDAPIRDIYPVHGRFEFSGVEPGRYVLLAHVVDVSKGPLPSAASMAFLGPGPAFDTTIQVAANEKVTLPPLWMPPREPETSIEVELLWSDGSPVARASVRVQDASGLLPPRLTQSYPNITDANGRTRFRVVPWGQYVVSVSAPLGVSASRPASASEPFVATDLKQPLRLVVPRP